MVHLRLVEEASYSAPIRDFLIKFNNNRVQVGQDWCRVRPPTVDEIEDSRRDKRFVKFLHPGTSVMIIEVLPDFITVECGDQVMYAPSEFLNTYIRVVPYKVWGLSPQGC